MSGLIIGLAAGMYLGNPNVRRTVDAAIKKVAGQGIDLLNSGTAPKMPPVGDSSDTQDEE